MTSVERLTAIVMARFPEPGRVKTRMADSGDLDEIKVARIAECMLACIVDRLGAVADLVLAVTPDHRGADLLKRLDRTGLTVVKQGPGDLGTRLDAVWRDVSVDGPVAFFGMDSPDVPDEAIAAIRSTLDRYDLAVGPTRDGGYWTLAANGYTPAVLRDIDWGGDRVYDQTRRRAVDAGLSIGKLPVWDDVDHVSDLIALRERLAARTEPDDGLNSSHPLRTLAGRLADLCDDAEESTPS